MSQYQVVNMETGKVVRTTHSKHTALSEANMTITKELLLEPTVQLINFMYRAMKSDGKIDKYGMIKIDGLYVGKDFFEIGANAGVLAENFIRLKMALSLRGFVKKTPTTDCKTWKEVMGVLGIETTNKNKMSAMKRLLTKNDVIREKRKLNGQRVFVVNPNILRNGTHTSDFCISTFKDIILTKVDKYNTYLMYLNGLLEYEDIE